MGDGSPPVERCLACEAVVSRGISQAHENSFSALYVATYDILIPKSISWRSIQAQLRLSYRRPRERGTLHNCELLFCRRCLRFPFLAYGC
jgi:hypothetical protein